KPGAAAEPDTSSVATHSVPSTRMRKREDPLGTAAEGEAAAVPATSPEGASDVPQPYASIAIIEARTMAFTVLMILPPLSGPNGFDFTHRLTSHQRKSTTALEGSI